MNKRINYVKKLQEIFNNNIGKKIIVNYYVRFETCTKHFTIKGIITKCFGLEDVIINTEENGNEFVNIYSIMGYTITN